MSLRKLESKEFEINDLIHKNELKLCKREKCILVAFSSSGVIAVKP